MTEVDLVKDYFAKGYSCSQSLLAGFGPGFGLDKDLAFKVGRGFGGGMGRGDICGAVSGAFMLLGFTVDGEERPARLKTYDLIQEFIRRFEAAHQTIRCQELLGGVNPNTPEGKQKAKELQLFTTVCPKFVQTAAEIFESMSRTGEMRAKSDLGLA